MSIEPTPTTPIELNGYSWYTMLSFCELLGKTDQTIRNWTKCEPPIVIKDESLGVKLYRLADGVTVLTGSPTSQPE